MVFPTATDSSRSPSAWRTAVALAFIAGVGLRWFNFTEPPLWLDEYGTWWVTEPESWGAVTERAVTIHGQSPLYYWVVNTSTELFGISRVSLRLPSLLWGAGLLALAYPLGRTLFTSRHAGLLAVVAFGVNERLIFYAQDARPYAMALFFVVLSFLLFIRMLETETLALKVGYVTATAAAYYAHYLFGFVVVVQAVYLLGRRSWVRTHARSVVLIGAALGLAMIPGLFQVASLYARREALSWETFSGVTIGLLQLLNPIVIGATTLGGLLFGMRFRRQQTSGHGLIIVPWLLVPVAVFGLVSLTTSAVLLNSRYVLFALPAAILVGVWLMQAVEGDRFKRWLPLVTFVVVTYGVSLHPGLATTGVFARWPIQDFAGAAQRVQDGYAAGDLIVYGTRFVESDLVVEPDVNRLTNAFMRFPVEVHLPDSRYETVPLPARPGGNRDVYVDATLTTAADRRRVWVLAEGELASEFADRLEALDRHTVVARYDHGEVSVWLFARS